MRKKNGMELEEMIVTPSLAMSLKFIAKIKNLASSLKKKSPPKYAKEEKGKSGRVNKYRVY